MKKLIIICVIGLVGYSFIGCTKKTTTTSTSSAPQIEVTGENALGNEKTTRDQITDPVQQQIQNEQISEGASFYEQNLDVQNKINKKIGKEVNFYKTSQKTFGKIKIVSSNVLEIKNFTYAGSCNNSALILTTLNDKKASIASIKSYTGEVSNDSFYYTLPSNINLLQFDRSTFICIDTNKVIVSEQFE